MMPLLLGGEIVIKSEKDSKRFAIIVSSLTVALLLVLGQYFISQSKTGMHNETVAYLSELSSKSADIMKAQINGHFTTLEAIATILGSESLLDVDRAIQVLKKESDKNAFMRMGVILPNGTAFTTDGHEIDFSDRDYFHEALEGQTTVSECLYDKVNGQEINVFATPIVQRNTVVGVVFATQTHTMFSEALRIDSFGGEGFSYIIDSTGKPVVETEHSGSVGKYVNLFETLALHGFTEENISEMRGHIDAGETGSFETIHDSENQHFCYAPVGINDWYIVTAVPSEVISRQSNRIIRNLIFLVAIMVVSAIIISYKMISFFQNNSRQFAHMAYTDTVTGYINWERFKLDAQSILENNSDKTYAIAAFDISKFKVINDMFGYKCGNDLLKFVSDIIHERLGEDESFCRIAADNFCVLMRYKSEEDIIARLEAIAGALESYIANYKIRIAVGIYVITEAAIDVSAFNDKANISRNIAKKQNQETNCHFFRDENRLEILHEKEIENIMDEALKKREFEVYLQPKYRSPSDEIVGAEALVRWNRSGVGLLPPFAFIPLFEKNGFIRKLDIYMFENVCKLLAGWKERFPGSKPISISVNISRVHLSKNTLPQDLLNIANRYGVEPELIEIELTESAVFENVGEMSEIMKKIKDAGFMISIDDFGSGYSSLASLKYLPADFVKMDKSFLDEAENDQRGEKIICGMIEMIKSLGMGTVAEGVETRKQLDFLTSAGCDIGQGYYWAKPMPVVSFEKLLYGE